jgi:hypothetical protein
MKRKLVSLKQIANSLKQNPVMADLTWEFMVTKTADFLDLIGSEAIYVNIPVDLEVKDFRAILPVDMMGLNGVGKVENNNIVPMTPSQDYLHDNYAGLKNLATTNAGFTYSITHSAIFTNFETGTILMSYRTLATDEECFPLIPGDAETRLAVESYIKWKYYIILGDIDQIARHKVSEAETEYAFNAGQCQSSSMLLNVDEMEALVNQITQILPIRTQHRQRFQFLGTQELNKIQ